MTSIPASLKQIPTDARNFVPVSSLTYAGGVNALNTTTGVLSQASWARDPNIFSGSFSLGTSGASSLLVGGKLRDLGKTYLSSGRVFRKVQAVVPNTQTASTFGVGGATATTPNSDYYTGYIELGWEGAGYPAPVARAP